MSRSYIYFTEENAEHHGLLTYLWACPLWFRDEVYKTQLAKGEGRKYIRNE